jgi:PHD/YefM family antitoxin component YafN of YafNO toxin-antitoxin module
MSKKERSVKHMARIQVRPARDLRNNYAEVERMLDQHDRVVITKNGVGHSVLINFDDYAKYEAYLHRQFLYEELQKSKAKMNDPEAIRHDADNVHDELEQILGEYGL